MPPNIIKNHARTHEENRYVICLLCWNRNKSKSMIDITSALRQKISDLFKSYDEKNECLPKVVCGSCKINLYRKNLEKEKTSPIDFSQYNLKRETRSNTSVKCDCFFCELSRKNGKDTVVPNNVFGTQRKSQLNEGKIKKPAFSKYCSKCFSKIHAGKSHICRKSTAVRNIHDHAGSLDMKSKEQVVSNLLKDVVQQKDKSKSVKLSQQQGGQHLQVTIGKIKRPKETLFTIQDFQKIRNTFNLSYKVTSGIATAIRVSAKNSKIIEPDLKRKLLENNHILDHLFDCKTFDFTHVKGADVSNNTEQVVYCTDLKELIEFVTKSRGIEAKNLKFGVDGGGGFLKVCLSIQSTLEKNLPQENAKKRARQLYSDGVAAKKLENSSVKKLLIIGISPCVQENYENVTQLWSELRINHFEGTIATDLKLANIIVGIMSHSSMYPCCWCYANKNSLHIVGEYRTVGNALKYYIEWCDAGKKKDNAKNYKNCIHPPIIETNEARLILNVIPPPELHLLLGVVNTLYSHMIKEFEKEANDWAQHCSVQREMTHGSPSFKGNSCKILLSNLDFLRSNRNLGCLKYVEVFEKFNAVVNSCFTVSLDSKFVEYIDAFKDAYLSLGISVTPKVHAVFFSRNRILY